MSKRSLAILVSYQKAGLDTAALYRDLKKRERKNLPPRPPRPTKAPPRIDFKIPTAIEMTKAETTTIESVPITAIETAKYYPDTKPKLHRAKATDLLPFAIEVNQEGKRFWIDFGKNEITVYDRENPNGRNENSLEIIRLGDYLDEELKDNPLVLKRFNKLFEELGYFGC